MPLTLVWSNPKEPVRKNVATVPAVTYLEAYYRFIKRAPHMGDLHVLQVELMREAPRFTEQERAQLAAALIESGNRKYAQLYLAHETDLYDACVSHQW